MGGIGPHAQDWANIAQSSDLPPYANNNEASQFFGPILIKLILILRNLIHKQQFLNRSIFDLVSHLNQPVFFLLVQKASLF